MNVSPVSSATLITLPDLVFGIYSLSYFWRSKARVKEDGEDVDFARILYFGEYMTKKEFMFAF